MNPSDMTALPDLLHGRGRSGPVRQRRPVYVDLLPPCNAGCPAGENIQAWLAHARAGRHEQAWRQLVTDNPLAAIHGRVCYHPCETACNRASLDSAVSIHAVERFLGDLARERGWAFGRAAVSTGRRALVIGSGPSGLSAAYHLARLGHEVEVRDSGERPGGMMRYGIPAYRLPRDVLDAELDRIAALGVRFTQGHRVTDLAAERAEGRFDAVFVAVGAHLSKRVDIPAGDAGRIVDAVSFLRSAAEGDPPVIGRRVAVYGGGNTAMDAARVARRLGAEDALIVYRRTRAQMPAHEQEAEDAEQEGVRIHWLRTITAFDGPELTVEAMELGPDGFPQPTGRLETLAADTVILALGQETDTAFLRQVPGVEFARDGTVQVSAAMMTGCPGVFAGGDMVPAERTVTVGVGHGKKAARHIDAWLRGDEPGDTAPAKHPVAESGLLNIYYLPGAAPSASPSVLISGSEVEQRHVEILSTVKAVVSIPVAVKLSPYFSSTGEMARRLDRAGADGLVLFNRFLQPDIDPETLTVTVRPGLSAQEEGRLPRTWIALLAGRVRASLAATTGVATADDVAKYLLAGADVVMTASALLRHGPGYASVLLDELSAWMARKGFRSVAEVRGLLAVPDGTDQAAYERAGYVTALDAANKGYGPW